MKKDIAPQRRSRKNTVVAAMLAAVIVMAFVCLFVGSSNMSLSEAFAALAKKGSSANNRIIWNIRIPRVLAAVIAGAGLSASGLVMQTNLNNPMASPSTLGVSNAAVFGANLSIIAFSGGFLSTGNNVANFAAGANPYATSLMAFIFSTLSILLILGLCRMRSFSPNVVVLAGLAVGAVWTAATTILQFYATDVGLSAAVIWNFGDLARATYRTDAIMLAAVAAGGLSDARRAELTLALSALPQKPVTAFDDETLFFALPPEEIGAFAEAARPLCEAARAGMAVSQTFALDRLSAQIRLCRFALLAAGTQTVFMREIGSTLFFTALERRVSLAPYLCEDVIRVMDEDATRGSALSRSLYAYLLNFMDLKKAAQQLGIHRNTLEYQVRKMNAVIGGQPDEQKRFMMMCTYKMLALPDAGVPEL